MKHRGVRILPYRMPVMSIHRGEIVSVVKTIGYRPIGVSYPMTKEEAVESVDCLIAGTMRVCGVDEKAAVLLLNKE